MKKQATFSVSESVMDKIKSGKVHMRPRVYFTLLGFVASGAVVLAGITTAYLSSIVFFWLRILTADTMAYGARAKLSESIASFPWWALVLAVLLVFVAVVLVRKQGHMYKLRTSVIVLGIVASSLLLGLVISLFSNSGSHEPNKLNQPEQRPGWRQSR